MDNLLKVPGTGARVGLNPVLDLIPGIGDAGATIIQALTIVEAARRKVPKIVLTRMALNVLLNGAVGVVPGVGEVFAFWFSGRRRAIIISCSSTRRRMRPPGRRRAGTRPANGCS